MFNIYNIILIILIIVVIILIFNKCFNQYGTGNLVITQSSYNGEWYYVHKAHNNKEEAANIMAIIEERLYKLNRYLKANKPNHPVTKLILRRYDPDSKKENSPLNSSGTTSYTVNKGEMIYFCLRSKETLKLHNINELMFVAIHELAHVGCYEKQHPPIFWRTFKFLLQNAVEAGVYIPIEYYNNPFEYCGMNVSYQPLYDEGLISI